MMDFGFKLSKSSTIDLTDVKTDRFEQLCKQEPGARVCIGCGSCSASCPAASLSGMSMRKVLLAMQRGQDVRPMLRNCMLCGKCTMVCPRGLNTRNIILNICRQYD
ncbi:MAG: 4Fe-4S dicluster domain-containing protein [Bacteroidaceae bacterium]|nr:4Fe-4S dicluster domain-containing protein [Bacteroidaceae bacterium]